MQAALPIYLTAAASTQIWQLPQLADQMRLAGLAGNVAVSCRAAVPGSTKAQPNMSPAKGMPQAPA